MKHSNKLLPLLALLMVFTYSCREEDIADQITDNEHCPTGDLRELHVLLGNPSNAANSLDSPENYLMLMDEYAISYNASKGIPNWVSWHLSTDWFTGDGFRQDDFRANPFLPADWYSPNSGSYSGSGYDRGHNCPSADRLCSDGANSSTFFMTNMVPQAPDHNREIWKYWECYFRHLAEQGNELYIVMGNYGEIGTIDDGDHSITIPEYIWKAAVVLPRGEGNDLDFIDAQSEVIAINIRNVNSVANSDWDDPSFITTVDEIETATGYDLFSNLPENVQAAIESNTHSTDPNFTPCW